MLSPRRQQRTARRLIRRSAGEIPGASGETDPFTPFDREINRGAPFNDVKALNHPGYLGHGFANGAAFPHSGSPPRQRRAPHHGHGTFPGYRPPSGLPASRDGRTFRRGWQHWRGAARRGAATVPAGRDDGASQPSAAPGIPRTCYMPLTQVPEVVGCRPGHARYPGGPASARQAEQPPLRRGLPSAAAVSSARPAPAPC